MVQMPGSGHPDVGGAGGGSDKPPNQRSHQDLQEKLRRRFQRRAQSRTSNSPGSQGASPAPRSEEGSNKDLQEKLRQRFQRRTQSRTSNSSGSQDASPSPKSEEGNGRLGSARVHVSESRRTRRVNHNNTPDMLLNDPDGNGNFMFFDGEQNSPKLPRSFKGFGKGQGQNVSPKVVKSDPIDSALNTVLGEMQGDKSTKKTTSSVGSGTVFQNNFDDEEELSSSDCLQTHQLCRVLFRMEDDGDGDDEDTETDDPPLRRGQGYMQGQAQNVDPIKQMMDSLMGGDDEQGGINANNDPLAGLIGMPRQGMNGGGRDNRNPFADMFGENVDNSFDTFFQNMRNDGHNALMNAQQSQNQLLGLQIGQENDPLPALPGQSKHSADEIVDRLCAGPMDPIGPMPGAENGFENVGQDRNPEVNNGIGMFLLGSGEKRVRRRHRGWESLWDPEDNPVISDGEVENPADNPLASLLLPFGGNNDNGRGQIPYAGEDNGGEEEGNKPVPRNTDGAIGNPNHMDECGRNPLTALLAGSKESSNDSNDLVQQTLQMMLSGLGGNKQNDMSQLQPDDLLSLMGPGQNGSGQSVPPISSNLREGGGSEGLMEGAGLMRPGFMHAGQQGPGMRRANAMVPAQMGAGQIPQGVMEGDDVDPENCGDSEVAKQLFELERMRAEQNTAPRADQALHTIIVLDISGSMEGEPFVEAGKFITEFINGLEEIQFEYNQQENVALVCVGESVQVVQHFTNNYSLIEKAADTLLTGGPSKLFMGLILPEVLLNHGSYDNRPGMGQVYQLGSHTAQPRVILISDGYSTSTTDVPGCVPDERTTLALQNVCLNIVQSCAEKTLTKIFCVPVGHNVNLNFLEMLSQSTGGRVVHPSEAKYLSRSVLHHMLVAKLKETNVEEPDRSTVVRVLQQVTAAADEVDVNGVFEVYREGEPDLQLRDQLVLEKARENGVALQEGKNDAMMMGKEMGILPDRGQGMSAPSGVNLASMLGRGQGMSAPSGVDLASMLGRGQGMSAPSGVDLASMLGGGQGMSAPSGVDFASMLGRGQGRPAPTGVDHTSISHGGRHGDFEMPPGFGSSFMSDQGGQGGQEVPKLGDVPPTLAQLMGLSGEQNFDGLKQLSSSKEDNHNQEAGVNALFGNIKRNRERQGTESDFNVTFNGFDHDQTMRERLNAENPISESDFRDAMQGGVSIVGQDDDYNQFGLNESMFQSLPGPLASAGRPNFSESPSRGQLLRGDQSHRQARNDKNGINQQEVNDDPIKQMSAMLSSQNSRERNSMADSRHEMRGSSSLGSVIPNRQQPAQISMLQSRQNEINEPSQVGRGSVFRRINPNPQNVQGGTDMAGYGGGHRMLDRSHQQSRQHDQNNGYGQIPGQFRNQFFNRMPPKK